MTPGVDRSRSPGVRRMQYNASPPTMASAGQRVNHSTGTVEIDSATPPRSDHHDCFSRLLLLWNVRVRGTTTAPEVSLAAVSNPGPPSRGSHAGRTLARSTVKPCMRPCLAEPVKTFTWGASITE